MLQPWNVMIVLMMMWLSTSLEHCAIMCHKLSAEERKFEKQAKRLSKIAVTTIQTKYGDWYNCVDFYEQPAFDHPMLKDRKFDYRMSSSQPRKGRVNPSTSYIKPFDIWVNGKGCPPHTVPIRKTDKYDVARANKAAENVYNLSANPNSDDRVFSILRTNEENKYYGGGMKTSIYQPKVETTQYSASRIKIQNGPDSIAVGWVVNPSLYPDNRTHLFIYTTTKDSNCYNTFCPGFIIMTSDTPPDLLLEPYSIPGGPLYEEKFFVRKDAANGDWFFEFGDDNNVIGSWPQRIFTKLSDSANYVEWGGEVNSPEGTVPPPMGAGYKPDSGKLIDNCFGRQVTLINDKHEIDHNPPGCSVFNSNSLYKLIDVYNKAEEVQRAILFGGPGTINFMEKDH